MALENGLSAAIMNPYSVEMQKAYHAFLALNDMDEGCLEYIDFASAIEPDGGASYNPTGSKSGAESASTLSDVIVKGLRDSAAQLAAHMLDNEGADGIELIQREIIPALNKVGEGFENKTIYLPSLLMSAEAASAAFGKIKERAKVNAQTGSRRLCVVLATVKGDIHDIGKNIVRLLLESYGFRVVDLGRDVPAERVVEACRSEGAALLGLSALMTTTVPAMEQTISLMRRECPECRIVVGGAVLSEEYAERIGADQYAADAMETVRYAEAVEEEIKNA